MGIDYKICLGPYVRCKVSKVPTETKKEVCVNKKCKLRNTFSAFSGLVDTMEYHYCPACGHKLSVVTEPSEEPEDSVDVGTVGEKLHDNLHYLVINDGTGRSKKSGYHYWLPNRTDDGSHHNFDPTEEEFVRPIEASDGIREVFLFREFYKEELKILMQAYGEDNVELQWGLISFMS